MSFSEVKLPEHRQSSSGSYLSVQSKPPAKVPASLTVLPKAHIRRSSRETR
jgi:hypothetical protein